MSAKDIENLRKKLGISQEELARVLGLHGRGAIYRWESGSRAPSETVRRLIIYLNELSRKEAENLLEKFASYETRK